MTVPAYAISDHVAHVLRRLWDPIGLGDWGPADEYDSYVPDVIALVRCMAINESTIYEHLLRIETDLMCLSSAPKQALRAARALLGIRQACGHTPDRLVRQMLSLDGLRCLWVFLRPDGNCFYEQGALRHEADENGTWSWWADAGTGRSGLFATSEEAEQDARRAIKWLRDEDDSICSL